MNGHILFIIITYLFISNTAFALTDALQFEKSSRGTHLLMHEGKPVLRAKGDEIFGESNPDLAAVIR